jgi:hypothetical protein
MLKTVVSIGVLALALAVCALGQTATPPATRTVGDVLQDPSNITFLTFLGANLEDAKTDWRVTGPLTGKQYTFTPAQRLSIALGSAGTALYLREQFPRLKKPITVGMGILTAYFAGRALANTYNHGPDGALAASGPAPKVAFAVRFVK